MYLARSTPCRSEQRLVLALQRPRPADVFRPKPLLVTSTARMQPRGPKAEDMLVGTVIYVLFLIITRALWRLIRAQARV